MAWWWSVPTPEWRRGTEAIGALRPDAPASSTNSSYHVFFFISLKQHNSPHRVLNEVHGANTSSRFFCSWYVADGSLNRPHEAACVRLSWAGRFNLLFPSEHLQDLTWRPQPVTLRAKAIIQALSTPQLPHHTVNPPLNEAASPPSEQPLQHPGNAGVCMHVKLR